MTNYPFTSSEMKAMTGVVQMVCLEANREAAEIRKKREVTNEQSYKKIVDCWEDTYIKANDNCGEQYKALVACLSTNERRSLKCLKLRTVFEECYVRKVMVKEEAEQS